MRWLLFGLLALGCVPPTVDLRGRACPCGPGWVCVADTCLPEAEARDGGADGGVDAGATMDAGPRDAGPTPMDAGPTPIDAGLDAELVDAGSDAGRDDAGAPDSGAGETGCDGALASAVLCDGFETSPGPWTSRNERLGVVTRSSARAEVGAYSLHSSTTAINGQASVVTGGLGPFTDGDVWLRVSIYVPAAAVIDDFTFLYTGEATSPYHGVSLGIGSDERAGSYSTISSTYVSDFDRLVVPRDQWVCFELHIAVAAAAGTIEVYMDGTLRASRTGIVTLPATGFTVGATGIDYTGPAQGPLEVFVDEYAFSRARLPCP